ncbi:MAG TPA: tetratricopeptide repeat protein [Myxococcota bacterium]|nr:tetratricopeptide repeat protein [Myxococcota bacterium]
MTNTILGARVLRLLALALVGALPLGCATVAEQRKLEYELNKMRAGSSLAEQGKRIAELSTEIDSLRAELAELRGRVEVAEHGAQQAADDARAARQASATAPVPEPTEPAPPEEGPASEELALYREAYDAWRTNDHASCVDRFGRFLQSFPTSKYADDAAFWLADCHYRQGDLKTSVLRFDEVATRYPDSDKAAEALFRQGEALLQMGPQFSKAAQKAFQRVIDNYPTHKRAADARERLAIIGG